jgi:zinc transport system ATP-binding protein
MKTVEVRDLSVSLGSRDVVSGVSFSASEGDLVAVIGPNGSGKSTLVRALVKLVNPARGTIRILGQANPGPGEIGYVPQIKGLDRTFPAQAIELVGSARNGSWPGILNAETRRWSTNALERVGAGHLAEKQVSQLSGGELQRVYLARALARDIRVLILDEPESGIDASGTTDLYAQLDIFRTRSSGTVVLVTHDWDVAVHHATHVLLMRNSQISFGKPSVALTESSVRAAFGHVGHEHRVKTGSLL